MIWIDFGIICIGQEKMSVPSVMEDIEIEAYRRHENSEAFYNESYHFYTADALAGYWYNIWLPDPICYEESFFDISPRGIPCVSVVPKRADHVRRILTFYLNESPTHEIAVLLRVQDRSDDVAHPRCKLEAFLQALEEGTVRWNELYLISL